MTQKEIDAKVEEVQSKVFTDKHIEKQVKLTAENELLKLEIDNLTLKETLANVKKNIADQQRTANFLKKS